MPLRWRKFCFFLPALVCLVAVACGGGYVSVTVGAGGGTVRTSDGAVTVEIPPGALSADTRITITRLDPEDWPEELEGTAAALGGVYELGPDGLTFSTPVTITRRLDGIDVSNGAPLILLSSRDAQGEWDLLDDTVISLDEETVVVTAQTAHFSAQAALGGSAAVSILPVRVRADVGDSWDATVETWVSPDVDVVVVFTLELAVGPSSVVGKGSYSSPNHAVNPGTPWETTVRNAFTCAAAGTGTFGITAHVREWLPLLFPVSGTAEELAVDIGRVLLGHAWDVTFQMGLADCEGAAAIPTPTPPGVDLRTPTQGGASTATPTPGGPDVNQPGVNPGVRVCGGIFGPCPEEK